MSGKLATDLARKYLAEVRDLTGFVFCPRDVKIFAAHHPAQSTSRHLLSNGG